MKLNKNQDQQYLSSKNEDQNKKNLVQNNKKRSKILFIFIGSFCLFLLANQAIWAQIESIYNSTSDESTSISGLMSAITNNDIEGVKFFSKGGPLIINQKNIGGATALHIACRESNTEAVKILLENGASLNIADNEGWTPLMRASLVGNADIVEMLIAKNAKADAFNSIGETALMHATTSRCLQCLNIIIEKGNLVKNVNLKTLKTQITDAFLLARNQEEPTIKTVLESFLDYVHKADTLLATQPTQPTQPEETTQEVAESKPLKKLTVGKKNAKKFALKTTVEQQEEPTILAKSSQSQAVKPKEETAKQTKSPSAPIKQAKLEPIKTLPKPAEEPKKIFKLKKPIEDPKNKIPTITQKSLPLVVVPVEPEVKPETVANSTKSTAEPQNNQSQENQQNTQTAENKAKTSSETTSLPTKSEPSSSFFKRFILKKPAKETNIVNNQEALSEPASKKSLDEPQKIALDKTPEKTTEEIPEKIPEKTTEEKTQKPQEEVKTTPKQEEKQSNPSALPDVKQKKSPPAQNNSDSPTKETVGKTTNLNTENKKPEGKLKKFKFSSLQDNKNKQPQTETTTPALKDSQVLKNSQQKNLQNENKQQVTANKKYKLKAISDSENTETEIEVKKLPVPQEI